MRRRVGRYAADSVLTTLVASLATSGFAVYHFNRLSLVGVVANLLAVPLCGVWVMPWGLAAMLLAPLGLEWLALAPMGVGIDWMLDIARWAAALPGAASLAPAMPGASLWLLTLGGLWLCFWRGPWRCFGLLGVALAFAVIPLQRMPDLMISEDARALAIRSARGLVLYSTRGARIPGETWTRRAGESGVERWPTTVRAPTAPAMRRWSLHVPARRRAGASCHAAGGAAAACAGGTPVVSVVPLGTSAATRRGRSIASICGATARTQRGWRDGSAMVRIETARAARRPPGYRGPAGDLSSGDRCRSGDPAPSRGRGRRFASRRRRWPARAPPRRPCGGSA